MRATLTLLVLGIAAAFTFSGCVSPGPQKPPAGAKIVEFGVPEIGTKIVMKSIRNGIESTDTYLFSKESFDGKTGYVWKSADKDFVHVRDLETRNFIGTWAYSDDQWKVKAKPNNRQLQFPLWAGKSYPADYNYWRKDGWRGSGWNGRVFSKVNVEDWEKITVPAGTFDTIKIVQNSEYFSFEKWYSPELKLFIKMAGKSKKFGASSEELLEIVIPQ